MKTKHSGYIIICCASFFLFILASCNKENSSLSTGTSQALVASTQSIAVAPGSTSNDSIYVIHACDRGHFLDSISESLLPAAITNYLTANYAGYTFQKAYTDKDESEAVAGYVVIIQFNGNPVGLKFDASDNFTLVLEQREGHDLTGKGWHEGGRFCNRNGQHTDTVNIGALPANELAYFSSNYPQDSLARAYLDRDGSYLVFSEDNGAYITLFTSGRVFIKRIELPPHNSSTAVLADESSLPFTAQIHLSTTYPAYVLNQAFSFSENGTVLGYVACIDANGTKYAIVFDASGNFVKVVAIR